MLETLTTASQSLMKKLPEEEVGRDPPKITRRRIWERPTQNHEKTKLGETQPKLREDEVGRDPPSIIRLLGRPSVCPSYMFTFNQ